MTTTRIKSVKLDGNRVEITGIDTMPGIGNEREWTFRCNEQPHPDFPATFVPFPPEIRRLLELPDEWANGALKVIKVTWSWSETTEVEGAVISCRADLDCATSPLIFNTPHLPYAQYSEGGEQPVMPDELQELLDKVKYETKAYLKGKRAQEDLFGESAPIDGKMAAAGERNDQPEMAGA